MKRDRGKLLKDYIIPDDRFIEFINLANECCAVMEDSEVAAWLQKPNDGLNMESPIQVFIEDEDEGFSRLMRLLHWVDIGEAD